MILINLANTPEDTIRRLRALVSEQRAEIARLRRRIDVLSGKPHPTKPGLNADGSMRCPYADIKGETACDRHILWGCTFNEEAADVRA